jgi:hypothetical protein
VRNFLAGLLLGVLATYWYFTQGDYTRAVVASYWARASAPPHPVAHQKP